MKQVILKVFLFVSVALLATSCGTFKKFVLLNDVEVPGEFMAPVRYDLKIKKGDEINVRVFHHDQQVMSLFNQVIASSYETWNQGTTYKVHSNGYVDLPIFDSVKVSGLTCREVEAMLEKRMEDEGIAFGATVQVKLNGFKVTIIGESGTGVHKFEDEGATILDLVAQGGISSNATRRDKIVIMRECDSIFQTEYISLLSKDLFYSPYFYLQQNDIIYVHPKWTTIWQSNNTFDYVWSRIGFLTSAASLVLTYLFYRRTR